MISVGRTAFFCVTKYNVDQVGNLVRKYNAIPFYLFDYVGRLSEKNWDLPKKWFRDQLTSNVSQGILLL